MLKITTKYDENSEIFYITLKGEYVLDENKKYASNFIEEIRENEYKKVLMDYTDCEYRAKIPSAYNRSSYFSEIKLPLQTKIACLLSEPNKDMEFAITALRNRGWNYASFLNRNEALKWLNS